MVYDLIVIYGHTSFVRCPEKVKLVCSCHMTCTLRHSEKLTY